LEGLRARVAPDVIFTHRRNDAHQDHREICQLTWNLFRDHLILEYEIPKWDGDLDQPNVYVPLSSALLKRKLELLLAHFGSQRSKDWFDVETFTGLARLRGMECRAPERYAEAFVLRKAMLR
jgi:LmbE family N-acetylglucosaminyl deacetylase